jgi:hypothetical protein
MSAIIMASRFESFLKKAKLSARLKIFAGFQFQLAILSVFLALIATTSASGQQLVQNGGFESGDFSLWSQSGNTTSTTVDTNSSYTHSGTYGAKLGPSGSLGFISQTLPTTPGQNYYLSLWLDSPNGSGPNEFQVSWNGTVIFDQTNIGAIGWTNLQFAVVPTGTNTVLQFGFQDNPSYLGLDDISLTPRASPFPPHTRSRLWLDILESAVRMVWVLLRNFIIRLMSQWTPTATSLSWIRGTKRFENSRQPEW